MADERGRDLFDVVDVEQGALDLPALARAVRRAEVLVGCYTDEELH